MDQNFDTIGIFAKKNNPSVDRTLQMLTTDLARRGKKTVTDNPHIAATHGISPCPSDRLGATCDLAIVVGGDGTFLDAGRAMAPCGVPLLGINIGRLGFMVDVLPDEASIALDAVFAGNYRAEERLMLTTRFKSANGQLAGVEVPAVNDCVVRNQSFSRVLDFDTYMNGTFISHHRADGMVVATPTGSTAYAMSGGGPVMHPGINALALVPVCPHTLSDRPLIVDGNHEIEIRIDESLIGSAIYICDGQVSQALQAGDSVLIARAAHDLHLIHPPGYDYFNILRNKLRWGRGQQTPAI